jgi:hypothetical protein
MFYLANQLTQLANKPEKFENLLLLTSRNQIESTNGAPLLKITSIIFSLTRIAECASI